MKSCRFKLVSLGFSLAFSLAVFPVQGASVPALFPTEVIRGPYLQNVTKSNIVVRWRTSEESLGQVRFGLTANDLSWEVTESELLTDHALTLTNLAAGTRYFYSIGTPGDLLVGGDQYYFTTLPPSPKPTRIWAIGDFGTLSAGYPGAAWVRDAYYQYAGNRDTDVWLMLGDNAYYSGTDSEYQSAVFDVYQDLLRHTPVWSTIGNHDARFVGDFPYMNIFNLPANGEAGGLPSGVENYYSFDYGNVHFVCLDSEVSSRSPGSPMLEWLEADLAANAQDWLIAFWHSPPYTKGSHDSDSIFDSGGHLVEMRENVLPILEDYGVDLVLSGHSHSYERSYLLDGHYGYSDSFQPTMAKDSGTGRTNDSGAYIKASTGPAAHQGAVYVVAGSSGWVTPDYGLNHPAMCVSLRSLGSLVIDVDGNRMDAKFLRETGAIDDHFTILKGAPAAPLGFATFHLRDEIVTAQWKSRAGHTYQVEQTFDLASNDWTPISEEITATGATSKWSGPAIAGASQSFYRVVRLRASD